MPLWVLEGLIGPITYAAIIFGPLAIAAGHLNAGEYLLLIAWIGWVAMYLGKKIDARGLMRNDTHATVNTSTNAGGE